MKTIFLKPDEVERKWYLIDAEGKVLGRLASRVVGILRGKNKPSFSPHWDLGDSVIIINAGEDPRHGTQARAEAVLPALGLSGWFPRRAL